MIHFITSFTSRCIFESRLKYLRRFRKTLAYCVPLTLSHAIPRQGKDVIVRLLDKKETTRLGSKSGASEVKQHKWFAKINWGLLRNTQPPVSYTFRPSSVLCPAFGLRFACLKAFVTAYVALNDSAVSQGVGGDEATLTQKLRIQTVSICCGQWTLHPT